MPAKKATKKSTKGGATKKAAAKASGGKCGGWRAIHDFMPPGPAVLRVTGECRFMSGGHKVTLKEAVPQGINPSILLLNKIVTQGIGPQIPQTVPVSFKKKTNTHYTKVTILPDGVTVKVQEVS